MANGRVWAIRGVRDRTRDAALEVAHAADLTIGEWIDQVLARAAAEARHPRPPAATREEVAELLAAHLRPVAETLGRLAERLAALEEKVDRRTGPASARTGTRGQHPRGPRLRLPDT
jgi:hypothetical protein